MNTFKAEVNKIILALTSVGLLILLIFPASLSASHYRYGTMSWEPISDNGTHVTIRLKMENGWTANHGSFRSSSSSDYNGLWVSGYIGSIKADYYQIVWGDGTTTIICLTKLYQEIMLRSGLTLVQPIIAKQIATLTKSVSIALFRKWEYTVPQYGQLD